MRACAARVCVCLLVRECMLRCMGLYVKVCALSYVCGECKLRNLCACKCIRPCMHAFVRGDVC